MNEYTPTAKIEPIVIVQRLLGHSETLMHHLAMMALSDKLALSVMTVENTYRPPPQGVFERTIETLTYDNRPLIDGYFYPIHLCEHQNHVQGFASPMPPFPGVANMPLRLWVDAPGILARRLPARRRV